MKTLSVEELLKSKKIIEDRSKNTIIIDIAELGAFEFRCPSSSEVAESVEISDAYLVSICTVSPDITNESLLKGFECSNGEQLIEKIFLPGQIKNIATEIMKLAGYSNELEVIKNIKN